MAQQLKDAHDAYVVALQQVLVYSGTDCSKAQQSDLQKQQPLCVFRANTHVFVMETL
jgi:hypothetical protein